MKVEIPCPELEGTPNAYAGHRPALPADLVFREFGSHTLQLIMLPSVFDICVCFVLLWVCFASLDPKLNNS